MLINPLSEVIEEIKNKHPNNSWLHSKLFELYSEIQELWQDRNRLVHDLSKARDTINRLRAELDVSRLPKD